MRILRWLLPEVHVCVHTRMHLRDADVEGSEAFAGRFGAVDVDALLRIAFVCGRLGHLRL